MRAGLVVALALCGAGCGSKGIQGTWRLTQNVKTQTGTVMASSDFVFLEAPDAWKVGGGCEAPLTQIGEVYNLTQLGWTCPLTSSSGLPFDNVIMNYQWKQGDVLEVTSGRFEIISGDKLSMSFGVHYRTDPNDPTVGDVVDYQAMPGEGAERVQ